MKNKSQERIFVVAVCFLMFFIGMHRSGVQLVINDICELFQIGSSKIGIVVAIENIMPLFVPLLMGILADKIGKKPVVAITAALFAVGCAVCGYAKGMAAYVVGLIIYSAGSSTCENISTAALADANEAKSMQYMNITQFLFSLGAFVGPLISEYSQNNLGCGWQFSFSVGFLSFLVMAVVLFIIKFPPMPEKTKALVKDEHSGEKKESFVSPLILCLACAMLIYIGFEFGFANYCDSLIAEKAIGASIGALTLSAYWGGSALSRLLFSFISYKPGRCIRLFFLALTVVAVAINFVYIPWLCILLGAAAGFFCGPIWSTINALAAGASGGNTGTAVGLMCVATGIGGIAVPAAMSAIVSASSVGTAIMVLGGACLVGAVVSLKIKD